MNIGETFIGRFLIEDLLPSGSQGDLAVAMDQVTRQQVVVKRMSACPAEDKYARELDRTYRAADIRVNHPNVLDPLELIEEDGEVCTILPYVRGKSLDHFLGHYGQNLSLDHKLSITTHIAAGLDALHAAGVVHRDLKPANVLINEETGMAMIIDLGICRRIGQQTINEPDSFIGTYGFAAPEQITDCQTAGPEADLYALGAIVYYMLTATSHVPGSTNDEVRLKTLNTDPIPPSRHVPGIPAHLDALCMRLLDRDPAKRYHSGQEVIAALTPGAARTVPVAGVQACPMCGCKSHESAKFCPQCGRDFNAAAAKKCLLCRSQVNGDAACPHCNQPFSAVLHRFEFASGDVLMIPEGIFEIGRHNIAPHDKAISRRHASLAAINGQIFVTSINPNNPVYVQGQPAMSPTLLNSGDALQLGTSTATYISN